MAQAQVSEDAMLGRWFQGDAEAVRLMSDLFAASQLADDLVDADRHGLDARRALASRLLILALVSIPANPCYVKWQGWMAPLLADAVLAWDLATDLEQRGGDESARAFAFAYRDNLERVIVQLALLIGGVEHARQVQGEVFDYFRHGHHDGQTFADFCKEHTP